VEVLVIAGTNFRALEARANIAAAVVDRTLQVLGTAIPGPG
jgi:hypothetical protein